MSSGMPPAIPVLIGALLVPFLPLTLRRALCVLAPLVGLVVMYELPTGETWGGSFLGYELIFARTDLLSTVFGLVFLGTGAVASVYGWHRTGRIEQTVGLVYLAGAVGVVFAGDLLSMVVAWEIMAVSSALLIFVRRRIASLRAGQRYLMVHLTAGGALLVGVLAVIQVTGSTAFGPLSGFGLGTWLILFAFCINAAVPPVHAWLPDAYPEATVAGSVFLSAFTTKAAVYCLIRGFAGSELLVWGGAAMALYGVVFAVMENNMRRLLAYHIISQVGYMVCAIGVGTALALNGAAGHAVCNILYKGLLFMAVGAIVYRTGRETLSDLGGLARQMPLTLGLYVIGGLSISGAPLFNGFIVKSMVVAGAAEDGRGLIVWLLHLASVGTFLSVGLKLPYFAWFGQRRSIEAREAPVHMLVAMAIMAAVCIFLGVVPSWLYERLPFPPVTYHPYAAYHVFETLLLLTFTGVAFWQLRSRLAPHRSLILDMDWFYRRTAAWVVSGLAVPLSSATIWLGGRIAHWRDCAIRLSHNPTLALLRLSKGHAACGSRGEVGEEVIKRPALPWFDAERQRSPVAATLLWVLTVFAALALVFSL